MTDNPLGDLRTDWRAQGVEADTVYLRLKRRRWAPQMALAIELAVCIAATLAGAWLMWLGFRTKVAEYSTLGAPLFSCGFSLAIVLFHARQGSFAWRDETPADLLRTGLSRVVTSLEVIRIVRWYMVVAVLVISIRVVALAVGTQGPASALPYTSASLALCLVWWLWLTNKRRRVREEEHAIRTLLREVESE